jgi:hypothetical protein
MIKDYQKETGKDPREQAKAKDVAQKIAAIVPQVWWYRNWRRSTTWRAKDDAGIISERLSQRHVKSAICREPRSPSRPSSFGGTNSTTARSSCATLSTSRQPMPTPTPKPCRRPRFLRDNQYHNTIIADK